jgi:hypothetical protein
MWNNKLAHFDKLYSFPPNLDCLEHQVDPARIDGQEACQA